MESSADDKSGDNKDHYQALFKIKKNPKSIEEYLNDIEFVKEAINANPECIDFIPDEIKKDKSVALECVFAHRKYLEKFPQFFENDRDVIIDKII